LDPRQALADLDQPLLADLPPAPERLVFVVGLHRSGTTFLYQLLADHFPLATTQLYHVTHYRRLLHAREHGHETRHRQAIAAYLQAHGLDTRGTDGIPLHPATLEEYAFILRKVTPAWSYEPSSAGLFDELLRKLAALQPDAAGLLLKNPHDFGRLAAIARRYPQARFVVIRRDPVRVLDSQLRAGLRYRRHPRYLDMLMTGTPHWEAFKGVWGLSRLLVPDALYARYLVGMLTRDMIRELESAASALQALPPEAWVEVSYEALMSDPGPAIARIGQLIGLQPQSPDRGIERQPRELPLDPLVEAAAPALLSAAEAAGQR
ncbi:MAG: sulfotransferase family protein, partial [Candidatus Sericytochromatia bacterium]